MKRIATLFFFIAASSFFAATEQPRPLWVAKNAFEQKVFIENKGQYDKERLPGVLFGARQDGLQYFFSKTGILVKHLAVVKRTHEEIEAEIKRLGIKENGKEEEEERELAYKQVEQFYEIKFQGAGAQTEILPQFEIATKYHFGAPNKGTYIASAWKKITYRDLYPGIDMEFYFPEDKQGFKYTFLVHEGADPSVIQMAFPDAKKMHINKDGDLINKSVFGEFNDHAPIANEMSTAKAIGCSFNLNKDVLSFDVKNYDPAQGVIIDPWTTTPSFSGSNTAYDVDWDNYGNCYVHGGVGPFEVIKFDNAGNPLWIYTTPFTWYYGDFAVDHVTGSCYIIEGFNSGFGANVIKLYGNGTFAASYGGHPQFQEMWRIAFSRCTNQAVIAGGGTTDPSYTGCYLDTNVVGLTPVNVISSPTGLHDMWGVALDDFGNAYMSTAQTQIGSPGYDNILYRMPLPGLAPLAWAVPTSHLFVEVASVYAPGPANGFNGMSISGTNLYTYDSYNLLKWSTASGASTGALSINGASQSTMSWGGLTSDDCDNIFIGSMSTIMHINGSTMSTISSFGAPTTVYDVSLGKNNNLYACGPGWVGNYNVGLSFCNSSVLNTSSSVTNASCGSPTGSATVTAGGGTGPYSYNWSNGASGSVVNNLPPGTYTVTITDNSCNPQVDVIQLTITGAAAFTVTPSSTAAACNTNNGTASVGVSGGTAPITINWSNGQSGTTATGLGAGTYTATVTDGSGCSQTVPVTVTQPPAITVNPSVNPTTCGNNNGSASVSPSGGNGSYTYNWSPSGGTGSSATNLPAGTYTCTVTDVAGCSNTGVVTVNASSNPNVSITSSSTISCNGGSNGSATASASGGSGSYTYTWSPTGGNGSTASGLPAGTYTVFVTDGSGCTTSTSITLNQPGSGVSLSTSATSSVSCNGGSNGSANASASGGSGSYTYTWSPFGGNSSTASGLPAGTYTCTTTDAGGCTATSIVTINQPAAAVGGSASSSPTPCGASSGSATVTPSGGNGSYSYTWSPSGGNSATASGLSSGNYNVTVQDGNGCSAVIPVFVGTSGSSVAVSISATSSVSCFGGTNGSATANPSGGSGSYTYTWSPSGGNAQTASGLPAGTYTCNITDGGGCTATNVVTISEPAAAVSGTGNATAATCGQSNGSASVNPSGGSGSYTYSWTPAGGTGSTASNIPAGNYNCTITDGNGCSTSVPVTVGNNGAPTITSSSSNSVTCNGSSDGSATVNTTGGTGTITYTWSPTGGNASTASNLPAGTYTCDISDASGCLTSTVITINAATAINASGASTAALCGFPTGSATVTASGGTGSYTYTWSPSGGNASTASGLSAGSYTCDILDGNNCPQSAVVTVVNTGGPTASITATSSVSCFGTSTGSATAGANGGTPGYTYTWTPIGGNSATASGLPAGTYTCTIADANSCMTSTVVTITEPSTSVSASASSTSVTCNATSTGAATVTAIGGTAGYTYTWSPTGGNASTATGLNAGTYTCDIADANGCLTNAVVTISEPGVLMAAVASSSSVSCAGGTNGSATVNTSGGTAPFVYSWLPSGGSGATASGLSAGTYTCNILDTNGCATFTTVTIAQPPALSVAVTATNVTCNGLLNGAAGSNASGGTGAYTYTWTPTGGNNPNATTLGPGTYTCTITDANGCLANTLFTITEPPALAMAVTSTSVSCNAGNNGSAAVTASGGTGAITYTWAPSGGNSTTASNLSAGTYTCFISDANGCQSFSVVTINQPAPLLVSATANPVTCSGSATGSAAVVVNGGISPYSINWNTSPPLSGTSVSGLPVGSYTATITDNNSCGNTAVVTILDVPPVDTLSMMGTLCSNDLLVVLSAPSGGIAPDTITAPYQWYEGTVPVGSNTNIYTGSQVTMSTNSVTWYLHGCKYVSTNLIVTMYQDISKLPQTNIFTPNGDRVNDEFMPISLSNGIVTVTYQQVADVVEDYTMFIYDRWGTLVFQTDAILNTWTGVEPNGKEASAGTYFWMARYKTRCNAAAGEQVIKGFVQLIR